MRDHRLVEAGRLGERPTLLARGMNDDEIATDIGIDEVTAKTRVTRLLRKLGVRDSVQAVVIAYEAGLVEPGSFGRGTTHHRAED